MVDSLVMQLVGAEDDDLYAGTGFDLKSGPLVSSQKSIVWRRPSKA